MRALAQILYRLGKVLRTFTGDPGLPSPSRVLRAAWSTDRFSLGSVSYLGREAGAEDFGALAAPLPGEADPRLIFAGEATSERYRESFKLQ